MSYKQMTGNIISATKVEPDGFYTNNAASGVWNLQDQYDYVRGGNSYSLASNITIPTSTTLVMVSKDNGIYLRGGDSLQV